MLSARYNNDSIPSIKLNSVQTDMIRQINDKIENGIYKFINVNCCVCNSTNFELLSLKDRYGLYVPVVACMECGLLQTNPRMDSESYNNFYNYEYRKLYVGTESPTNLFFINQYNKGKKIFKYLKSNNIFKSDLNNYYILEVGCGAGGILQYFKEAGCLVKGCDLGEEYILFGKNNYHLDLSVGGISDIKLGRKPDIIIYSHVFEHLLDLNSELLRIRELLSENGVIYIEVPGVKNLLYSYDMDFLKLLQNAHTYHLTLTCLKNIMIKNNFKLVTGNEKIMSIFKKVESKSNNYYTNDYKTITNYLKKIELLHKILPFAPYRIKEIIRKLLIKLLILTRSYILSKKIQSLL